MLFDNESFIIAGIALGIICITVALYALKYRTVPGSTALLLIMAATAAYTTPYMLQLASSKITTALFWYNISLPGANLLGPAWLMFALAWTGEISKHSKKNKEVLHLLFLVTPLVVCLAAWTNPLHGYYGTPIQNTIQENIFILNWNFGLFYWIGFIHSYILFAVGTVILISKALKRLRLFFNQTLIILVGALIPVIFNVAYQLGFSPIPHLDLAPFGFIITGILWGFALFFYRFLKITQISQESVFERMPVGMIMLDFDNRVVDINPAAREMVNFPIGQSFSRELPANVLTKLFGDVATPPVLEDKKVIHIIVENEKRFFNATITPFHDIYKKLVANLILLHDITVEKRTQISLAESENRLRRAQQVGKVGNWEMDIETRMIWASDEAFAIYGLDQTSETIPISIFNQIQVERYRPLLTEALNNLIADNTPYDLIYEIKRKSDGQNRFIHTVASIIKDAEGKPEKVVGVIQDITDQKLAENLLRQSEERFKHLAKIFPETIYEADPSGTLTYINTFGSKTFGIEMSDLDNETNIVALIHPDDCEKFHQKMIGSLNENFQGYVEFRAVRKNGVTFDALAYSGPILIDGIITGTRGFILDISQRKKIEQALAESETNFHTFFDTIDDVIIVASPDGKIIAWNAALQEKLGYSAEDLSKMHILDINPKDRREEAEVIFDEMLSGYRSTCPLPLVTKNSILIPAETRIWLGKWNGRTCVYGVSKDLSTEQEAQQRLESMFRNNPALMALTNADNREFLDVNNSFLTTLGYSKEEVLGKTAADLGLFYDTHRQSEAGQRIENDGRIKDYELKVKCKDGRLLDGLFSGEIINIHGTEHMLTVMIDITERKLAEQALQKSELQFRALFEQAAVGVAVIDANTGNYQRINEKYSSILGFTCDAIMATSCESITHPEDVESSKQMFKDLVGGAVREFSLEKRYIHKDGHFVWVDMNIAAMWAEGEEPTSLIMVVQDISERKTAEAAMRESDAKMRAITESAQDAIIMMDSGGKISYWNPAAETILGYSHDEAIGQHLHSLIAPQRYHVPYESSFSSFSETGQGSAMGRSHEMEAKRKDGTEIPIRLSLSNFQMNGLWYAVGIISDISDMKKATRELQEQYQFANQIINTMGQGLTVTDSDGRFEFINPAYGRMFGYDSDSLIGKRPQDITLPVDHDVLTRERNNRKAGLKTSYENRLICADGRIADVLITSVPRESDGKYAGAIAVITDLSEQKRYQKIQGVIYKIAQAMVAKSGINELYFSIHTILKELLPVENFFIALYDEETDLISYPYVVDQYDSPPAPRKPGRGLTEYVLRTGKPVLVTPEAFDDLVARGEVEQVGTESVDWVGSPLIVDGKIIGVMAMQSYIENIRFSLDDMKLLEFVSNQVGLAIVKKRGEEMQMHQSTHDRLTGLYNRQYYETEIARLQLSRRFPVSILMMDVDNLKMVNDKLGHTAGDELLKTVARILNCSFRPEDMVARVGGDEFVAVLPETDAISAGLVVKRLLKSFELHNRDSKPYQVVSVSIGCSTGDQNCLLTEVFKEADHEMYIQKEAKKNRDNT